MSNHKSLEQQKVEDQLAQLRIRYSVVLRAAQDALNEVTKTSLDENPDELQVGSPEVFGNITSVRNMLDDMLYIIARSRKLRIRTLRYGERSSESERQSLVRDSEKAAISSTRETKAVISTPRPALLQARIIQKLQDAESSMSLVEAKISNLSRRASAKSHRNLLEELSGLKAKHSRLKDKVASFDSLSDLLDVVSPSDLLWTIKDLVMRYEGDARVEILKFIQHGIIHTLILALMSSSIQPNPEKPWLAVAERITQLVSWTQQARSSLEPDIFSTLAQILDHPAIMRLTMHNHELKKKIKQIAKQELATSELKTPKEEDIERIEYWLLSQVWVSEEELMIDSFAILAATSEEKAADRHTQMQNLGEPIDTVISYHEPVQVKDTMAVERSCPTDEHSAITLVQGRDELGLDLPSAPSNKLSSAPEQSDDSDEGDESGGEAEIDAQRLINIFASSSARTSDAEIASISSHLHTDEDEEEGHETEEEEEQEEEIELSLEERLAALALLDQAMAEHKPAAGCNASDGHIPEADGAASLDFCNAVTTDKTLNDATRMNNGIQELNETSIDELLSRARRALEQSKQSKAHDDNDGVSATEDSV